MDPKGSVRTGMEGENERITKDFYRQLKWNGSPGEAEINSAQHYVCYMAFFFVDLRHFGCRNFRILVTPGTGQGGPRSIHLRCA